MLANYGLFDFEALVLRNHCSSVGACQLLNPEIVGSNPAVDIQVFLCLSTCHIWVMGVMGSNPTRIFKIFSFVEFNILQHLWVFGLITVLYPVEKVSDNFFLFLLKFRQCELARLAIYCFATVTQLFGLESCLSQSQFLTTTNRQNCPSNVKPAQTIDQCYN